MFSNLSIYLRLRRWEKKSDLAMKNGKEITLDNGIKKKKKNYVRTRGGWG